MSPHVTIYKFPITALSSITNRVTGVGMKNIILFEMFSLYLLLIVTQFCSPYRWYHRHWCCFVTQWWCAFVDARYINYIYFFILKQHSLLLLLLAIGSSAVGPIAKIAVSFPLIYHYLGGVRHIVWDKQPETHINNESVEKSR